MALRDWTFSPEEVVKTADMLDKVLAGDLSGLNTAYDITQWFRGHLFTLVDNLLGADYDSDSQVLLVLPFFEKILAFGVKWIQEMPARYSAIYQNLTNAEAYLTDKDCAYAEIWPELFLTIERLFGSDERLLSFFKSHLLIPDTDLLTCSQPSSDTPNSPLIEHLIGKFEGLGGFSAILHLLRDSEV